MTTRKWVGLLLLSFSIIVFSIGLEEDIQVMREVDALTNNINAFIIIPFLMGLRLILPRSNSKPASKVDPNLNRRFEAWRQRKLADSEPIQDIQIVYSKYPEPEVGRRGFRPEPSLDDEQIKELIIRAATLPLDQRTALIDEACGKNEKLKASVQARCDYAAAWVGGPRRPYSREELEELHRKDLFKAGYPSEYLSRILDRIENDGFEVWSRGELDFRNRGRFGYNICGRCGELYLIRLTRDAYDYPGADYRVCESCIHEHAWRSQNRATE